MGNWYAFRGSLYEKYMSLNTRININKEMRLPGKACRDKAMIREQPANTFLLLLTLGWYRRVDGRTHHAMNS